MNDAIDRLITKFQLSEGLYLRSGYKEQQMRIEFLDPILGEFGWDVANSAGLAAPLREVISEDSVEVEGRQKAPDYGFRLGQRRQFFLEAKAPSKGIFNAAAALQIRRYGWSAKLPISILTDFRHFAIYDCRLKPYETDDHNTALVKRFDLYKMTAADWKTLKGFLHRDHIEEGSLSDFLDSPVDGKGAVPVDEAFLADLEIWRARLAVHLYKKDRSLSKLDLTSLVQKNVDRLLFLRIAEDRGAEPHGKLLSIADSKNPFEALIMAYEQAEARYNSSLFHFSGGGEGSQGDSLTARIPLGPKILRLIIKSMYRPQSPYEFGVFSVELLGQIYEQFLGSEIEFSSSTAQIVQKPEVKKAGGVYYTPADITELICKEALVPLNPSKSQHFPDKNSMSNTFRLLDPACGSGSFLIEAYQQILDKYLLFYNKKPSRYLNSVSPRLVKDQRGNIRLSIDEKKRILLSHIFGADIDHQAVEVSKLSLLLKMLEGENQDTLAAQMDLFEKRVLPDLSNNIVAGNSLVGTDFFEDLYSGDLSDDELDRQNPFDWDESFPFLKGNTSGFQSIVGNPPYIDSEWMVKHWPSEREYCANKYDFISGNWDIYCAFIGKSIGLLEKNGFLGFIVPNKILSADYGTRTRKFMSDNGSVQDIFDYSSASVFPVAVYPIVMFYQKGQAWDEVKIHKVLERSQMRTAFAATERSNFRSDGTAWYTEHQEFPSSHYEPLGVVATLNDSATVSEAYKIKELIVNKEHVEDGDRKVINSGTIDPGVSLWGSRPMRYLGRRIKFPVIEPKEMADLSVRRSTQAKKPKILVANMTKKLEAYYDSNGSYVGAKSVITLLPRRNPWTLSCIINSDFFAELYTNRFSGRKLSGGYIQVAPRSLERLPIPKVISPTVEEKCKQLLMKISKLDESFRSSDGPTKLLTKRKYDKVRKDIERIVVDLYKKDAS